MLVSYSLSFPDPKDLVWNVLLLVLAAGRQGLQVLDDDKVLHILLLKIDVLCRHGKNGNQPCFSHEFKAVVTLCTRNPRTYPH